MKKVSRAEVERLKQKYLPRKLNPSTEPLDGLAVALDVFEKLCEQKRAAGLSRAEAMFAVEKENPIVHAAWLCAMQQRKKSR